MGGFVGVVLIPVNASGGKRSWYAAKDCGKKSAAATPTCYSHTRTDMSGTGETAMARRAWINSNSLLGSVCLWLNVFGCNKKNSPIIIGDVAHNILHGHWLHKVDIGNADRHALQFFEVTGVVGHQHQIQLRSSL